MSTLSEFFQTTSVESLREKALLADGIDILGVYCLHTGKRIGTFEAEELEFAISDEIDEDDDSIIDALLVRVVASMRPTPALNKPDRLTIQNLCSKRPVDALAYLANRLHAHRSFVGNRDDGMLSPLIARIALHRQWTALYQAGVDLTPWVHWLLEIDAKMNLHDVTPPCVTVDRLNKLILTNAGTPLLSMVTVENNVQMLATFESWVFERIDAFDKRDNELAAQGRWTRGNTMSGPAFIRSWITNPEIANKKLAEDFKKKQRAANGVGRPKSERTKKLDARVAGFLGMLDDILASKNPIDDSPIPAAKPRAKLLTGGMLKFAPKKEV